MKSGSDDELRRQAPPPAASPGSEPLTERVAELERTVAELRVRLAAAQKQEVVARLCAGVAHDFNNLLTVIVANAQILGRTCGPAPELEDIRHATEKATSLTRQLLGWGRGAPYRASSFDLGDTIAHAVKLLRRLIGDTVTLDWEAPQKPVQAHSDPQHVVQAVLGLALTMRDACPCPTRIVVSLAAAAGDATVALVRLRGESAGAAAVPHVPDLPDGVAVLAAEAGLDVQLGVDEAGLVASLSVALASRGTAATERSSEGATARSGGGGERILVVEDEEAVRRAVVRILRAGGYQVSDAADGTAALAVAAAEASPLDLLVTDIVMPGMSGRELARRLAAAGQVRAYLYMTGYDPEPTAIGSNAPPGSLLQKPFPPRALLTLVRRTLDGELITA